MAHPPENERFIDAGGIQYIATNFTVYADGKPANPDEVLPKGMRIVVPGIVDCDAAAFERFPTTSRVQYPKR